MKPLHRLPLFAPLPPLAEGRPPFPLTVGFGRLGRAPWISEVALLDCVTLVAVFDFGALDPSALPLTAGVFWTAEGHQTDANLLPYWAS